MKACVAKGALDYLFRIRVGGTNNCYLGLYMSNGDQVAAPLTGNAFCMSENLGRMDESVLEGINVEYVAAKTHVLFKASFSELLNSWHFEANRSTGVSPHLIYAEALHLGINGLAVLDHRFEVADGMDSGTTGAVLGAYGRSTVSGRNVNFLYGASANCVDRPFVMCRAANTGSDARTVLC